MCKLFVKCKGRRRIRFKRKKRIAAVHRAMYFWLMKESVQMHNRNQETANGAGRLSEGQFWQAVAARDARFDGSFVYAVRSTGIYCRPSCPSRRPRRPHVAFFPLPEAAERAGFRSCLRCRPRTVRLRDPQAERVQKVCRYIAEHLEEPLTLARLGRFAGSAPHHLQRTFKHLMGITPRAYADALRLGVF